MKRKTGRAVCLLLVLVLTVLFCPLFAGAEEAQPPVISFAQTAEEHLTELADGLWAADNELIVHAAPGTAREEIASLAGRYGALLVGEIGMTRDYQLRFGGSSTPDALRLLAARLETEENVASAHLHMFSKELPQTVDYTPDVGDQWRADLENSTDLQGKSWHAEVLNAPAAWRAMDSIRDYIYPVKVGVYDTGFVSWHEDLSFDVLSNLRAEDYDEHYLHGTGVAGAFAANGNNSAGIVGIYPYGYRNVIGFSAHQYYLDSGLTDTYVECVGMRWLMEQGARVINCSMADIHGQIRYYYEVILKDWDRVRQLDDSMREQGRIIGEHLQDCLDDGYDFLIVHAAGNNSNGTHTIEVDGKEVTFDIEGYMNADFNSILTWIFRSDFPDVYDRILVVGSLSKEGKISDFSCAGDRVDIYAPGEWVYTTDPGKDYAASATHYDYTFGTSVASPLIAGAAADVLTINPWLRGDEVRHLLKYLAGPYKNSESFPNNPDILEAVYLANDLRDELALGKPNGYGLTLPPRHADVDRDGAVTSADARYALRLAVKLEDDPATSIPFRHADMDKSGGVSAADARAILRIAVKLDPLPITY